MVFGKQFRPALGGGITRDRVAALVMSLFVGLMLMLTLGGCGSGSGNGNNNNNNGNNGNSTATPARITGRVIDQNNSNQPVAGAVVTYGSVATGTDGNGNFSMDVPSGLGTTNLTVVGPAAANGSAAYYNSGYVGPTQYSLANVGFPVTTLTAGEQRNVGTIIIFSQTGPPPPPIFP